MYYTVILTNWIVTCVPMQGRYRHIRGKVIFPDFFSRREMLFSREKIPILVDPKLISVVFKSEKQKKQTNKQKQNKTKKSTHLILERFPASISNFPPFLINFHPFSLFSRYVSKNFPVRSLGSSRGAIFPPPPITPLFLCNIRTTRVLDFNILPWCIRKILHLQGNCWRRSVFATCGLESGCQLNLLSAILIFDRRDTQPLLFPQLKRRILFINKVDWYWISKPCVIL